MKRNEYAIDPEDRACGELVFRRDTNFSFCFTTHASRFHVAGEFRAHMFFSLDNSVALSLTTFRLSAFRSIIVFGFRFINISLSYKIISGLIPITSTSEQ